MTKFLTEIQADIDKVKGYIETKQSIIEGYNSALKKEEQDLVGLKEQLKELEDEKNYLVEFDKWKKDKKTVIIKPSEEFKEATKLESTDIFSTSEDKSEDTTTKRRGIK